VTFAPSFSDPRSELAIAVTMHPETTAAEGVPQPAAGRDRLDVAFYTVCDSRFFPGLVALVNSLRLHGHDQPIVVVDCGLSERQREVLGDEVALIAAPSSTLPVLLKYVGPTRAPADVMVLVDSDIIATRSLDPLLASVREGKIVAFEDPLADRFFESWRDMFDLPPLRRQPYVNAGFIALPHDTGLELLERLEAGQRMIDPGTTMWDGGSPDHPMYFPDQDVLNALLASVFPESSVLIVEQDMAPHPPFAGVSLADAERATCAYDDGRQPFLLHHMIKQKPWLGASRASPYSELLPRLWFGPDLVVSAPADEVPMRFRAGPLAAADRVRATLLAYLEGARGRLGLRRYLRARLERRRRAGPRAGDA
jgi:hypothetical protein